MKRAVEVCAAAVVAAVVIGLASRVSGCASVDCGNSGTAEFPAVEKWWK